MENKNLLWVAVAVVVVVAVAVGVRFVSQERPVVEAPADSIVEQPGDGENGVSEEVSEDAMPEENQDRGPEQDMPEENDAPRPSIETTPYTVYIGSATKFGTSSAELMQAEVGEVVVGYEWEAIFPSPPFATVVLPEWNPSDGSAEYAVEVWDEDADSYELIGSFSSGEEIEFPREGFLGALRFRVTGIDPALRICPGDRSFTWDARFTFDGELGLVRAPLTEALPFGETCRMR